MTWCRRPNWSGRTRADACAAPSPTGLAKNPTPAVLPATGNPATDEITSSLNRAAHLWPRFDAERETSQRVRGTSDDPSYRDPVGNAAEARCAVPGVRCWGRGVAASAISAQRQRPLGPGSLAALRWAIREGYVRGMRVHAVTARELPVESIFADTGTIGDIHPLIARPHGVFPLPPIWRHRRSQKICRVEQISRVKRAGSKSDPCHWTCVRHG